MKLRGIVPARSIALTALVWLMATTLTACKADSNYFSANNASVGSGDGGAVDATAGMRIRLKAKSGVEGFMHKFGSTTTECEIPLANKSTPTKIQCMANMMEYDLWFYGYEYELSVPLSFCDYMTVQPYSFYTSLPGYGPAGALITTTDGKITACTVDGQAGTINGGGTSCSAPEATFYPDGTTTCSYDYSQIYDQAPNCCDGKVSIVLTANITAPASSTTTTSLVAYGGKMDKCRYSAHEYDSSWPKTSLGKAATIIIPLMGNSLYRSQKLSGSHTLFNDSKRFASAGNFLNAGFHDWAAYVANPSTWITTHTTPRGLAPGYDLGPANNSLPASGATAIPAASDGSEVFQCLGAAGEVKHEIRLYMNEWNTYEDFMAFKANGDASAVTPLRTGTAGVDCSSINNGFTCNSIWGFDDLTTAYGASAMPTDWGRGFPN